MAKPRFIRPTPPQAPGKPLEKQPRKWGDELLSPWAVLGLLALLIQPIILWVRFRELSNCLAMTRFSDHPLGFIPGTSIAVTSCQAIGIAITLVQMLSASVAITDTTETSLRCRALRGLAVAVLVIASLLDLGLAVATAPDLVQGTIAFTVALLLAVGEPLTGILVIDCLIVPLLLTLFGKFRR